MKQLLCPGKALATQSLPPLGGTLTATFEFVDARQPTHLASRKTYSINLQECNLMRTVVNKQKLNNVYF